MVLEVGRWNWWLLEWHGGRVVGDGFIYLSVFAQFSGTCSLGFLSRTSMCVLHLVTFSLML